MKLEDKLKNKKENSLQSYLDRARTYKEVEEIFKETDEKYHGDLERRLLYHIDEVRKENKRLKYFGKTPDTIDRLLVPIDVIADAAGILTGIGYGISVGKELVEAPFKIANTLYYTAKTKEYTSPLKDLGYELLSFVVPGSLLDLTNRYTNRVDKYMVKEAVRRFVKEAKDKSKKKPSLVDITEELRQAA